MQYHDQRGYLSAGQISKSQQDRLAAILQRNLRKDGETLEPDFATIVWEIWVSGAGGSDRRILDPAVVQAINEIRLCAHRIVEMDEFLIQASAPIKKAVTSILSVKTDQLFERVDVKGRPTAKHADDVATTVLKYYTRLYQREPTHYKEGDFVNLLFQIFDIFKIEAKASVVARKSLRREKSTVKSL